LQACVWFDTRVSEQGREAATAAAAVKDVEQEEKEVT